MNKPYLFDLNNPLKFINIKVKYFVAKAFRDSVDKNLSVISPCQNPS